VPEAPVRIVGTVARALALLDALAASESALGVSELARRTGVNTSTASRLLVTLEHEGYVEREQGGPYRLALKLVVLGDHVLAGLEIRTLGRPLLEQLVAATGETATLSVAYEQGAVTIDFVPAESTVATISGLGRPSVAHATATGKVMLAFAPSSAGGELPDGELRAYTDRTITDAGELVKQLESIREQGFAEAVSERELELSAMAAPVHGSDGELIAIVGLQGPSSRLTATRRRAVRRALLDTARALGRAVAGE
jgi:IclR family acetate operon transcriptional repressor